MSDTSLSKRQQLSADLANARQTLELLKSQLRSGVVEQEYWMARLDDLSRLLEALADERNASLQQGRFAALYEVSKVLGSSLNLEEVLNQVMDAIIQLTGAERGYLLLFEEGELVVMAARNLDRKTLDEADFAISRSVIRAVAETGEQVVTTNATEDPRFAGQASVVAHNLRSIQCVPLRARGKIIGVIYVDNRVRAGVFDESDLEVLATFAAQAAIAIENARLFTHTDEALAARVEELSMMQEIDRQLNQTLDFAKVMDLTLDWATHVTKADNGAIGLIDLQEGKVRLVAQRGNAPSNVETLLAEHIPQEDEAGSLTAPIQREGRVIGVIALNRSDHAPFPPEVRDFTHRLADHAAIAIENAQLYEAVQQANRAKSEFVSVVTHELRIPMTSIKGYTDMILMTGDLGDKQKGFLDIIRANVERMSLMVSDLSDISRIESGRMQLEIEKNVDAHSLLQEVLPTLENEIQKRGHTLVLEFPDKLPGVTVDPRRLAQVFTNLISNAYKYTPDGGTITVRAARDGDFVRFSVSDTGIGMTPEEVSKLFTKFWRSESVQVREQAGTGLGLTIAKNLVELHGGKMTVESQKDVGTTFSFTLPLSQG